jgi:RimJ/RimL family protein N-acetyltransferase
MVTIASPFPRYALPRLWRWADASWRQVADDFAPRTLDEFVSYWETKECAGMRSWEVIRDGEMGGVVTSLRLNPVLADAHCIFKKSFWGHETTAEALRLVFEQLFADGVLKIETKCFHDNHALLGLVGKLGFEREGTRKQSTLRGGKLVDRAAVGLTKENWERIQKSEFGILNSERSDILDSKGASHELSNGRREQFVDDQRQNRVHHVGNLDQHAKPDAGANVASEPAVHHAAADDDAGRRPGDGSSVHGRVDGRDELDLQRAGEHAAQPVPIDR